MSDKLKNVFYVAIARRVDSITVAEFGQKQHSTDVHKLISSPAFREKATPGKHISLKVRNGAFLHMLGNQDGLVVVVVTEGNYPQRVVYNGFCSDIFEQIKQKNVDWRQAKAGGLNRKLKVTLNSLCKEYDDVGGKNKISKLRADVAGVQNVMQDNISKALSNLDNTEILDKKAEELVDSTKRFQRQAKNLAWKEWLMLQKMRVMLATVLLLIIIVVVIYIWSGGNCGGESTEPPAVIATPASTPAPASVVFTPSSSA